MGVEIDADLLDAIRGDPGNPELRAALAVRWAGRPEGLLVGILLGERGPSVMHAVFDWFRLGAGWSDPGPPPVDSWDDVMGLVGPIEEFCVGRWELLAMNPGRWPDRAAWHGTLLALAWRLLPAAREFLTPDDPARATLEAVASSGPEDDWRGMVLAACRGPRNVAAKIYSGEAGQKLQMKRGGFLCHSPKDEIPEQYRVLGWGWLGLPPMRPEAVVWMQRLPEEPPASPPGPPGRGGLLGAWRWLPGRGQ